MAEWRRSALAARLVAAPVIAGALLLAGCGSGAGDSGTGGAAAEVHDRNDSGMHGAVLDTPYTLPATTLTRTDGEDVALTAALDHDLTLVFFGYTNCPDICQAVMADLASTKARLSEEDAAKVAVWFVTTDPARDDVDELRSYLDRFNPEFAGFTGPLPKILEVAEQLHIPVEKGPKLPSGGYDVTHGTPILAVDRDGTVPVLWTEGTSAAKLAEDVTTVLHQGVPGGGAS